MGQKIRVGDVIVMTGRRVVVIGIRLHPIVGRLEAICQPILRDLDSTVLVIWRSGGHAEILERNFSIAANVLDRKARNARRHARLCRLERTKGIFLFEAQKYERRSAWLRKLAA